MLLLLSLCRQRPCAESKRHGRQAQLPGTTWPAKDVLRCEQVQEVGDGNINFVYIVEGPKGGLVVKQGLPYIRIAPDWPLTQVMANVQFELGLLLLQVPSVLVPRLPADRAPGQTAGSNTVRACASGVCTCMCGLLVHPAPSKPLNA